MTRSIARPLCDSWSSSVFNAIDIHKACRAYCALLSRLWSITVQFHNKSNSVGSRASETDRCVRPCERWASLCLSHVILSTQLLASSRRKWRRRMRVAATYRLDADVTAVRCLAYTASNSFPAAESSRSTRPVGRTRWQIISRPNRSAERLAVALWDFMAVRLH